MFAHASCSSSLTGLCNFFFFFIAASYGQPDVGTGTVNEANYGNTGTYQTTTGTGTGNYGQTTTGTGTGTYGQTTGTDTYGYSTGTGAGTGAGVGSYPEAAYTSPPSKEAPGYNSTNYNATAPAGANAYNQDGIGNAEYGQYSDQNANPPPSYMAAKTQQFKTYYTPADRSVAWRRKFCTALCCCLCLGLIIAIPAGFTSGHRNAGCQCWNNNDCYNLFGPGVYCYSDCRCYRG